MRRRKKTIAMVWLLGILFASATSCDDGLPNFPHPSCYLLLSDACCKDHDPLCTFAHVDNEDYCACPEGRWSP